MTTPSNNSASHPTLIPLPFHIKLYTENNPRKVVDGKVISLFCIFCAKTIRREEKFDKLSGNSIKEDNAITCSLSCFEPIKEIYLGNRIDLPLDTLEALFYPPKNSNENETKETLKKPKTKLYLAKFPLYLENNPQKIVNRQLLRKYCIYCAEEIKRRGGAFENFSKNSTENRLSSASMTASACESCCIKVSYVFLQDFVSLPSSTEKELFVV